MTARRELPRRRGASTSAVAARFSQSVPHMAAGERNEIVLDARGCLQLGQLALIHLRNLLDGLMHVVCERRDGVAVARFFDRGVEQRFHMLAMRAGVVFLQRNISRQENGTLATSAKRERGIPAKAGI